MPNTGDHAVVLGASMAGLLAARALSDFYRTVTVVDRDVLPLDDPGPRRGVPQGRHAHLLSARGVQIAEELFPGLLSELAADGAVVWSDGDMSKLDISFVGHKLLRTATLENAAAFPAYYQSRPFLESHVRRRLRALGNVTMRDGHDVVGLSTNARRDRITRVRVTPRDGGDDALLSADLVVDATGRGSRTPTFLEGLGYGRPSEDEVVVQLVYASQPLWIPPGVIREYLVGVFPTPDRLRLMVMARNENDSWILTVGGMLGEEPPADRAGMLDFIEEITPAYAMAALRTAEPLGEVARYRVPSNRWRRYDKMPSLPEGLLVFGDAICSFNPIYGQGMTVAAMEAMALRECLGKGTHGLAKRFSRAAAKVVGVAWQMAAGSDLTLPGVQGRRSPVMGLTNRYTDKVLTAAESDPYVAERFMRTMGFIDPPTALLHPRVLMRAATARRRQRRPGPREVVNAAAL